MNLFSERGTLRPELGADIRTVGFERRVTVIFVVYKTEVLILRILYAGREMPDRL